MNTNNLIFLAIFGFACLSMFISFRHIQLGYATIVMDENSTIVSCEITNHAQAIPILSEITQRHEECHCGGEMDELKCDIEAIV